MEDPLCDSALATEPTGRVVGDFALRRKIGEGGFGTVYLAEQRALGRPAVVKVMRRGLSESRDVNERFVLEARLASRLDHPCAAHIYAFGAEPDGTLWIAMEYVKGTALDALLEHGPLSMDRFMPMFERLCEAVQTAHAQGIVHRDIKPANVMITATRGRLMPKLLDFGIAKQVAPYRESQPASGVPPTTPTIAELPVGLESDRTLAASTSAGDDVTGLGNTVASMQIGTAPVTASLTRAGQILGSPPYMAPEQWKDPALVGTWSDQYALALLAYEALSGRRAFVGKTMAELVELHFHAELPPGDGITDAVHAVLARAAAKDPQARYRDLDELVAALRQAAGWIADDTPVAVLPAELSRMWIADAPQPIAESIATLATARTPSRVSERVVTSARIIARWLGVLAIACRSRLGFIDDRAAATGIRTLRTRALRDEEWLELAVALASELGARPEQCPIPELATWCADRDAVAHLRALAQSEHAIIDGDLAEHERAARDVQTFASVLERLEWMLDYEVGRELDGGVELWNGLRHDDRVVRRNVGAGSERRVVVLDADGARVVALSPLVAIACAFAGGGEEMFVLSGPARSKEGALLRAWPRGYERDDDAVWAWLATHVLDAGDATTQAVADERPPYPGLAAFGADDRTSFVGREREVAELVNRLRVHAIVVVVGPSGAGKTSFLAAGVVPALPASWRAVTIRPGRTPLEALAAAIDRQGGAPYRDRVAPVDSADLVRELRRAVAALPGTLVLIVDQSEELFTQRTDETTRETFGRALIALAESSHVRVVIGVRDDFLCRLEALEAWRDHGGGHVQVLTVPGPRELERIIVEPARRRGYELEDPALARRIVDEVAERPGALPLLCFAAAKLWERRDRHFHRISTQAYEDIGGVTGALVQHADGVVEAMPAADRKLVRLAFRRLLTSDGARILLGRSELALSLGDDDAGARIVERLIAARLVVSRDDDEGERIEIIHETLATTWPRLAAWLQEDAASAKLHAQLVTAARHWNERDRPEGLLWRGAALAELQRHRDELALGPVERDYAAASVALARRMRRRKVVIVASAFAVLASAVVALAIFNRRVVEQRAEAEGRVATGFEERGRQALLGAQHGQALLYLTEAARRGVRGPAHDLLVARAAAALEALDAIALHGAPAFEDVEWGGSSIVTVDPQWNATLRDAHTYEVRASFPSSNVFPIADGAIAFHLKSGDVSRHDASGRERWRKPGVHGGRGITGVIVDPVTSTLLTYRGSVARVWSLDGGEHASLDHGTGTIRAAAFDARGERVAIAADGDVRIWAVAAKQLAATCQTGARRVWRLRFAGDRVIAAADDGVVRICDSHTGAIVHTLAGHMNHIAAMELTPDGSVLATASYDGMARLWRLADGQPIAVLGGHRKALRDLKISPDGRMLATAGEDASIRIWDVESATQLATLEGHTGIVRSLRWLDATRLASAGQDGTMRHWNVTRAIHHRVAAAHDGPIKHLEISRERGRMLTRGGDGVRLWDVAAWTHVEPVPGKPVASAAIVNTSILAATIGQILLDQAPWLVSADRVVFMRASRDGGTIAIVGEDGTVRLKTGGGQAIGTVALGIPVHELVFDGSGRWLFVQPESSKPAGAIVIDARSAQEVTRLAADATVTNLAVDAKRLAVATDTAAIVFELGSWRPLSTIDLGVAVTSIALVPDGRVVVATGNGEVSVRSAGGTVLASLPGGGQSTALDVTDDGWLLAVGTSDGAVDLWDLTAYRLLANHRMHRLATWHVDLDSDGTTLVTAGQDGRVARWSLARSELSVAELAKLVHCRVPLRLEGESVLPRVLPYDDPTCN